MIRIRFTTSGPGKRAACLLSRAILTAAVTGLAGLCVAGCGGTPADKQNQAFFTSGNREADQRARQRMAKSEQLAGSGEGAGEKGGSSRAGSAGGGAEIVPQKLSLYERLGRETGVSAIVADFLPRVMDDPRVNWHRVGIKRGGFSFHAGKSMTWKGTTNQVATLQQHMVEFLALATGGPAEYTGGQIKNVHEHLHITNPEFDAAIGDLKASLDKLKIANREQKELLAIIESTRPQVVTER